MPSHHRASQSIPIAGFSFKGQHYGLKIGPTKSRSRRDDEPCTVAFAPTALNTPMLPAMKYENVLFEVWPLELEYFLKLGIFSVGWDSSLRPNGLSNDEVVPASVVFPRCCDRAVTAAVARGIRVQARARPVAPEDVRGGMSDRGVKEGRRLTGAQCRGSGQFVVVVGAGDGEVEQLMMFEIRQRPESQAT